MKLRAVTWNVHSWRDSYFRQQFPEMLSILHDLRPDLLFIQEALWNPARGVYSPEIAQLRADLEMEGFAMCTTHHSPVRHHAIGLLILSRNKLCNIQHFDLGATFAIKRRLLLAQTQLGRTTLNVATAHLSPIPIPSLPSWRWAWLPRPSEMRKLVKVLGGMESQLVLGLDMNATPQTEDFKRLNTILTPASQDHCSHISGLCLDYIFTTPRMNVSPFPIRLSTSPSDHYPVAADIIIPG